MMYRLLLAALMICAPLMLPRPLVEAASDAQASTQAASMQFEWVREGPADKCGTACREWIAASGPITVNTAKDFEAFSETRDLAGATMVLDSGGGSVLASLELGRKIRALGIRTSVGRTVKLAGRSPREDTGPMVSKISLTTDAPADAPAAETPLARLSPRGECASMCVFVLLGGVQRAVPAEARILVHQIWPGTKRHDASAENYTAEEIVRVQRDVGRIARYTVEMGGDIELFELAMRIPPWERLRALTPAEQSRLRLHTLETAAEAEAPTSGVVAVQEPPTRRGVPLGRLPHRGWAMTRDASHASLVRRHVLTIEGEEIGQFELSLACEAPGAGFKLAYLDTRAMQPDGGAVRLTDVTLWLGGERLTLAVESSGASGEGMELRSRATATVATELVEKIIKEASSVLVVGTRTTDDVRTSTRFGNTGLAKEFPRFAAICKG